MAASIFDYRALITSEHADKPKFVATVSAAAQPFVDLNNAISGFAESFDVDEAVGVNLDAVGAWVGISRVVSVPLQGVYFTFDDEALGFDTGYFKGRFDPLEGPTRLDDKAYRVLLKSKIAANHWDGTLIYARAVMAGLLTDNQVYVQDNQDMSITVGVVGPKLDALLRSLLVGGYLELKPEGVQVDGYLVPSPDEGSVVDPTARLFGFDAEGEIIAGFDAGAWGVAA